ncbi:10701_t:CDS:1, partial [Ambispora gerdemannii]
MTLYNFVISTPERKEFLYKIKDWSKVSQTGLLIANEIEKIVGDVGLEKFAAVVTDNGGNVRVARERTNQDYL